MKLDRQLFLSKALAKAAELRDKLETIEATLKLNQNNLDNEHTLHQTTINSEDVRHEKVIAVTYNILHNLYQERMNRTSDLHRADDEIDEIVEAEARGDD